MSYNTKAQIERAIKETQASVIQVEGTDTYRVPKLSMTIKMRPGKCVKKWIRKYIEDRNNLSVIERQIRFNSVGADHIVPIPKIPKKAKK